MKQGLKLLKSNQGFSLIEIMVALGLAIVIGGIATTQYANYTERAKKGAVNSTISALQKAVGVCIAADNDTSTTTGCLNSSVKNTISENPGIKILHSVGGSAVDKVCYLVVQYSSDATAPTNVPAKAMYGKVVFDKKGVFKESTKAANNGATAIANTCT